MRKGKLKQDKILEQATKECGIINPSFYVKKTKWFLLCDLVVCICVCVLTGLISFISPTTKS